MGKALDAEERLHVCFTINASVISVKHFTCDLFHFRYLFKMRCNSLKCAIIFVVRKQVLCHYFNELSFFVVYKDFMDMLSEVLSWGAKIQFITGDSWYSSTANLKTIRKHGIRFMFGIDCNRKVSPEKGQWFQLRLLPDFHQGQVVWLKDFGFVQLFKTQLKEQQRFYIVHQDEDDLLSFEGFHELHSSHWKIEQYHRVIKQVCHIEKFQVRRSKLILNHIFSALMAYVEIQKNQFEGIFENVYRWQKKLFRPMIKNFIDDFILDKNHLPPQKVYK